MSLPKLSGIILSVSVVLLLLSFASYLFWDGTVRTALAMFSALTGFLGLQLRAEPMMKNKNRYRRYIPGAAFCKAA